MKRRSLGVDVLTATRQRISTIFDDFEHVCVAFSGGKDSTVVLHLTIDEAIKRKRKIGLLFIDWEAQYELTIACVANCFRKYADYIYPFWIALPLRTTNACSDVEPEWICWDRSKRDLWVRQLPSGAITDEGFFPFYTHAMTFEEFIPAFSRWYSHKTRSVTLVGIRTTESINRWRTLFNAKRTYRDFQWTTDYADGSFSAYPIYDWCTEDIWTYYAKSGREYNRVYDLMHKAGLTVHKMRICEPYGDEQRQGLWLYHVLEPETWGRVVARVAGANSAALYAKEKGNILGNNVITKPPKHSWESYARFLLKTLPPQTAEHYRNKFSVWRHWYESHGIQIEDSLPGDLSSEDMPSWRRLCKVLLKHDYWCRALRFAPTKTSAYEQYKRMMKKRRERWGVTW